MPVGSPKKQTIATEKYARKVGLIGKTYKLKRALVDEFANACTAAGVSQSAQLSAMMEEFIKKVNMSTNEHK